MVKICMATRDDYENPASLDNFLANQLLRGRLMLVLGAGISNPFNIPLWNDLIQNLYTAKKGIPPNGYDLKRQAELFRIKYFKNDYKGYVHAIHNALYKNVDLNFSALRENATLAAIGALVMSSCRGSASTVVTFNFDNILELYLSYHGFITSSVSTNIQWTRQVDVSILHPHGLIPHQICEIGGRSPGNEYYKNIVDSMVFDQRSYSQAIADIYNPLLQKLLALMRERTCIFLGLSGKDDNLDSLLFTCKESHVSTTESSAFWGINITKENDQGNKERINLLWEERGVYTRFIEDYRIELPQFLFNLCQQAAQLHEKKS